MAHFGNSFNGVIDEIPQISVDNFDDYNKKAYFLSHCHTDHTNGLFNQGFSANLERTDAYVYMSELSALIIRHDKNDYTLQKRIRPLKLGRTTVSIPGDDGKEDILNVTLIPAGHCFGSVMILFKINNKNILFTGDFRINSNDISKYAHFHIDGEPITIHTLYVDTTFQDVKYEHFPKRSESVDYAVTEIRKWLELDANNRISLNTSAAYGYEYVFNEIYNRLNVKVYVDDWKWRVYSMFPSLVPGVTNREGETRIHICRNRTDNLSHEKCCPYESKNIYNYLHIKFSALIWKNYEFDTPVGKRENNFLRILFATHCSRRELQIFVNYFNPKRVVGFPNRYIESPNKIHDEDKITLKKRTISPRRVDKCKVVRRKLDSCRRREMFD